MSNESNEKVTISFPVVSFRRLDTPNEEETGRKCYLMIANIKSLPLALNNWLEVNPRHANTSSSVAQDIRETLETNAQAFLFKNRGLTILANRVYFDNKDSKNNTVKLEMADKSLHGLLDGGNTFRVIQEYLRETEVVPNDIFIKIEVIEGFRDRNEAIDLVDSRNSSVQVKDVSLFELKKYFEDIKHQLKAQKYEGMIAYKEFELDDLGERKNIPVQDILSYLICFDIEKYDLSNQPVMAYSGKLTILDYFEKNRDRLKKYMPLLPKILELWDVIQVEYPKIYNETGRLASLEGIIKKQVPLVFLGGRSEYKISKGYLYPILAAFRAMVEVDSRGVRFVKDPLEVFHLLKKDLVTKVTNRSKELENPNQLGKDRVLWESCLDAVRYNLK